MMLSCKLEENSNMHSLFSIFTSQVHDFRKFMDAVFTLLRTILGDFNFHEIEEANRVLGPIFFICYVFFVFFVLLVRIDFKNNTDELFFLFLSLPYVNRQRRKFLWSLICIFNLQNMFLAIINDTYSEVKAEIANQRNEFEIADYFKRGYNNMMGKFGKRDKIVDIQNALKISDENGDGNLSFDEIRKNLKKYEQCVTILINYSFKCKNAFLLVTVHLSTQIFNNSDTLLFFTYYNFVALNTISSWIPHPHP